MNPNYNPRYNQNYTWAEVEEILSRVKACVAKDQYYISLNENRLENQAFIDNYYISTKRQKRILLNLEVRDFCYSLNNENKRYQSGPLYVFMPQVPVLNFACQETAVDLYIKISIVEQIAGNQIIVISFHERNYPPMYLFR